MDLKLEDIIEQKSLEEAVKLFGRLKDAIPNFTYPVEIKYEFKEVLSYIMNSDPQDQVAFVLKTIHEVTVVRNYLRKLSTDSVSFRELYNHHEYPLAATKILQFIFRRKLYYSETQILFLIQRTAQLELVNLSNIPYLDGVLRQAENTYQGRMVPPNLSQSLEELEVALLCVGDAHEMKLRNRVSMLRGGPTLFPLSRVDTWIRDVHDYVENLNPLDRSAWLSLLAFALDLKTVTPSEKWFASARNYLNAVGKDLFCSRVIEWFSRVSVLTCKGLEDDKVEELKTTIESIDENGFAETFFSIQCKMDKRGEDTSFFDLVRTYYGAPDSPWMLKDRYKQTVLDLIPSIRKHPVRFAECNNDALKGLVWYCSLVPCPEISRALGRLCEVCFKKLPGVGPLAPKVGNACINVLAETGTEDSLAQLGRLRYTIRLKSAQKIIGKAFEKAAQRMGVGRDELEEMSVPSYGPGGGGDVARSDGGVYGRVDGGWVRGRAAMD
ncbi:MAG: hypothetical protein GX455_16510 [Phycisphaerae bacterium]|nr:hypothetical protein [Phycisphaerae bacterium]